MSKKKWQEPVIRSIDQCDPIFGACGAGSTQLPDDGGPVQCEVGNGAGTGDVCVTGNGNTNYCNSGNGAAISVPKKP